MVYSIIGHTNKQHKNLKEKISLRFLDNLTEKRLSIKNLKTYWKTCNQDPSRIRHNEKLYNRDLLQKALNPILI
jgi:hypothetical protein